MSTFKFKQFTVNQAKSAAKITTDATVMAALIAVKPQQKSILEVGSGTGVISLMLAQRFNHAQIEAVEIEYKAFSEAKFNFVNSPWSDRLKIYHEDFNNFNQESSYDLIVSNPPFFVDNYKSATNLNKNTAYHTDSLSFRALGEGIERNLAPNGQVYIMLPPYEMKLLTEIMNGLNFHIFSSVSLQHKSHTQIIREIVGFERKDVTRIERGKVIVKDENNNFHPSYKALLKDFLLIF